MRLACEALREFLRRAVGENCELAGEGDARFGRAKALAELDGLALQGALALVKGCERCAAPIARSAGTRSGAIAAQCMPTIAP